MQIKKYLLLFLLSMLLLSCAEDSSKEEAERITKEGKEAEYIVIVDGVVQ